LTTEQLTFSASRWTAPESAWRTTSASGCMAFRVMAVSISVSPFLMDEVETDMLMTSPPSRLPASSKLVRVRVESSKNRLIRVRPLRVEAFLSACRFCSTNPSARSRRKSMSGRVSPSIPRRWRYG
jgi:hypothetical protein